MTTLASDRVLRWHKAPIFRLLRRSIPDTPRTRYFQASLDAHLDRLRESGRLGAGVTGVGRAATAPLAIAAFCWRSPLSRHHADPALLHCFSAGLQWFTGSIREDGLPEAAGVNGAGWAHGWDIEGLIYGLGFCGEMIDPDVLDASLSALRRAAGRLADLTDIGAYGNQRAVYTLGLSLYGQLFDDRRLLALADRHMADWLPKVLDLSGQVVEQHGPCMHYSYTAFFYAWLNLAVRGDEMNRQRIIDAITWFQARHTRSLYPMAGPSARLYNETLNAAVADLLPAAEMLAEDAPAARDFVDQALAALSQTEPHTAKADPSAWDADAYRPRMDQVDIARPLVECPPLRAGCQGHGASPLMWAMLFSQDQTADSPALGRFERSYERLTLHGRTELKYALIRRRYQTHFNFRDFLPFSGIQTWAWGAEPPIIHPTPRAPSTTRGDGLDTARQGTSHNWGLFGAGAMAIDGSMRTEPDADASFLAARYDRLWKIVFFTEASVVQLEVGGEGSRRSSWTLNRVDPSEPTLEPHIVRFAGRRGCVHTTLDDPPRLVVCDHDHRWTRNVQQLVYDCGGAPVAFGFSDDALRFEPCDVAATGRLGFTDASGQYELTLHPALLEPCRDDLDVYQVVHHGTRVRRLNRPA